MKKNLKKNELTELKKQEILKDKPNKLYNKYGSFFYKERNRCRNCNGVKKSRSRYCSEDCKLEARARIWNAKHIAFINSSEYKERERLKKIKKEQTLKYRLAVKDYIKESRKKYKNLSDYGVQLLID